MTRALDNLAISAAASADADPRDREIESLRAEIVRLRARLSRAEELADSDPLTPLLNRRAFMRELTRTIATVARYAGGATLLYFDLDDFKAVNDQYGHPAGDAVLTAVAERLAANVRQSDIVARLGGDEFAVVLTRTTGPAAAAKALGLVGAVCGEPVRFGDVEILVKASCGVKEITGLQPPEQVLAEADADMFLRKPPRPGEL